MLGNIKFIGELGKQRMISEKILHQCITQLLAKMQPPNIDIDDVECLCKLFETVGLMLDHEKAGEYMDTYFKIIQDLSMQKGLPARITFMLQDVADLRANKWQPRRTTQGMKTIKDFRKQHGWVETKNPNSKVRFEKTPQHQNKPGMNQRGGHGGGMYAGGLGGVYGGMPPNSQNRHPGSQFPNGPLMSHNMNVHNQNNNHDNGSMFRSKVPLLSSPLMENGQNQRGFSGGFMNQNHQGNHGNYSQGNHGNYSGNGYGGGTQHTHGADDLEQLRNLKLRKDTAAKQTSFRPQNMQLPQASQPTTQQKNVMRPAMSEQKGLPTTQGARFVAPVKVVVPKKQKSRIDLERATRRVYEEYVHNPDMVEAQQSIKDMDSPDFLTDYVTITLTLAFEDTEINQNKAFTMLKGLHAAECISSDNVSAAFKTVLDSIEDLRLDAPKIDRLMANLSVQLLQANIMTFAELLKMLKDASCYEVFWFAVQMLAKKHPIQTFVATPATESATEGEDKSKFVKRELVTEHVSEAEAQQRVRTLIKDSALDVKTMMPNSKCKETDYFALLKAKDLGFLEPLLEFETRFADAAKTQSPDELTQWLSNSDNIPADVKKSDAFVITVFSTLLDHICTQSTFVAVLPKKDMQGRELQQFRKYAPVLKHIVEDSEKNQMLGLYAVQVFCYENKHRLGDFMQRCFMCLYRLDVCDGEVFMIWKEDINDQYEGKGNSLFQVNAWLNWLEDEMNESSDEEED
ncbi:hypothetical protein SARC_03986 [Sphaeroforma arctica JP610]|uniref:Eukaryotic translation initiation factor 4 gamma 2 n=1 Tax=Sphaeroforma arctica JP610 TaxID=667725 RepID=A0A0L0G429_9EUKA|nr:hypothetical protein SARC_03986 [Sphaeroforma arctica JP610]KNC83810.1 hypothetical protein SARC_03986 [Sphaeroforma arctica JP610]|eukprot:XP_014157712.1 hypothetical protein SARC_03986 [Sphaeroforma arctica JP610]